MDKFLEFINQVYPLDKNITQELISKLKVKTYKSGDHLCEMGEVNDKLFFVIEGVTRTYMIVNPNTGAEVNKTLSTAGDLAGSVRSLVDKSPAKIACQCLSDAVIIEANVDDLAELRKKYPEFSEYMYKTLEIEYTKIEEAYIDLLSKNATERYLNLRKSIKNIDQLIPQFQIASHLGITPIQLSRIRKKLLTQ